MVVLAAEDGNSTMHRSVLAKVCPDRYSHSTISRIDCPEHDMVVVASFLEWAYEGEVIEAFSGPKVGDPERYGLLFNMYLLGEAEYLQSDGFKRYVKQELDTQSMRIGEWYGQDFEMAFLKTGPDATLKEFCIEFMENNIPRQKQALADLKKLAPQLMQRTEKYISIKRARAKPKE